jgi:peptidoglycan/LPS O-acetylase OafA/YrhL
MRSLGPDMPLSNVYIAFGGEKRAFWSLAVEEQFYLL